MSESKDEMHYLIDNSIQGFQHVRLHSIEAKASADYQPFLLCTIKALPMDNR